MRTGLVVVAGTDVGTGQAAMVTGFTDPVVYSRWLGVPVAIEAGNFACTVEWGRGCAAGTSWCGRSSS